MRLISLIKKECKVLSRDRAFLWSGGAFVLLSVVSQIHGMVAVSRIQTDHLSRLDATRESHELYLAEAKENKVKLGAHLYKARIPVTFPLPPGASLGLATLEQGITGLDLSLKSFIPQVFTPTYFNPIRPALGSLDYWGILSFFVPLWVLALCFNLYSKEEELGTLRQLRAEGLGTAQILMPKAISVAIMIGGFIFSMSLLSWLLARPSPDGNRMIRIFVAQCAYLLFWVGMGVAVAALRLSSARSALMALTVWVSLNWVVPEIFNLRDRPDLHESSVRILSRHRTTLNRYWDLPKKAPLEAFNHPPEWMKTALENTDEAFSWGWYYSMHEATDEQFRSAFESNRIKSEKHSEALAYTSLAGWFESYLDAQIGLDTRERSNSFEVAQRARLELLTRWFPWMVPDQELEVQQVRNLMRSAIHQ